MNYYGKIALRMRCPHCNVYGDHRVTRTDSKLYYCGKQTVSLFQRIAGKDISYRRHLKRCKSCRRAFFSIEMADVFLDSLVKEVQQLEGSLNVTRSMLKQVIAQRDALSSEQKETYRVIRAASKSLNFRLPERKSGPRVVS